MKRNRKKSSTKEKAKPSTSAKLKEENDLAYFVHDRVSLMREVFSILRPKEIKTITPECVRKLTIDQLEELCLEELLGISSKRLCAILDGAEPSTDTESSSSSSSSSSKSEKSKQSLAAAVLDVICLDSESNDEGSVLSKRKKKKMDKKKKKKPKRKSTENASNSDATVETVSTRRSSAKKSTQKSSSINTKNKQTEQNNKELITNEAILNRIGGKSAETFSERVARGKEASRAAERVGMTVMEILEVQARARAIRAQLNKEKNDASQAAPSTSTNNNTRTKPKDGSDSEVEIKEEAADIVDLLTSSEDEEQKPKVEELEVAAVKEPDPPPASTKNKDKTKIKKSKTVNPKPSAIITTEETVKTKQHEETSKTTTPSKANKSITPEKTNKKRQKGNQQVEKGLKSFNSDTDITNLPSPIENLPVTKNNIVNNPETQVLTSAEVIKQEDEERESSPDVIILEDSDSEVTADGTNKKRPDYTESNDNSVQSVVKLIHVPNTTEGTKTKRKNDITITVTPNSQRKIMKDRNNVVISFSNVANENETERVGNSFFASTQKKVVRDRSSDVIEQSAKKLNSTVTKIIKERSKGKYIKSVVQKASEKGRSTRTNKKERDKASDYRSKAKDKNKETDDDEITLQLSDSEKMALLEDLNPKVLDKISEHTGSDTNSSDDSSTSNDESVKSEKQDVTKVARDDKDKKDLNQGTDDKSYGPSKEKPELTNNDTDTTKQNDDSAIESVTDGLSTKRITTTAEITIPKNIVNDTENELSLPVKTIISNLRVDEMVLGAPRRSTNKCIADDDEELSNKVNITKENSFVGVSEVSNINPCESNSNNEMKNPFNHKTNSNVLEICSIRDIPVLSDYESDDGLSLPKEANTNLNEQEIIADKGIPKERINKSNKKNKKKRTKLSGNRDVSTSSSDDILESNDTCKGIGLSEVRGKEFINESVIDGTKSITKSNRLEDSEQTKDIGENLQRKEILQEKNKVDNPLEDSIELITKDPVHRTQIIAQNSETKDCHTDENQLKTDNIPRGTNQGACTSEDGDKGDCDETTIEKSSSVEVSNKMAIDDRLDENSAVKNGGENKVIVSESLETLGENKDVQNADLEEGEITDDYKRQLSEEGEITTDTESEIEARDVVPETICISEEEICTAGSTLDKIRDKDKAKETKNTKKRNLCNKCKRKKDFRIIADQNFYRNSISENKLTENVKVRTIDESLTDQTENDISTIKKKSEVSKIANNNGKKELEIDKVSLDSESDSDSDSYSINSDKLKKQSKKNKTDKFKPEIDKDISHIDLLSPHTNLTDSDTLETLEISDDSSDCYEILSKEPTTEEIEALSEKIDRIDRIEVVTREEMIEHENSVDTEEVPSCEISKTTNNQDKSQKSYENVSEPQNINENHSETIADENISWKDRYMKSKKVLKVLTTSNILNALRKKNLDLKKKLLESKIVTAVEEIPEIVEVVPDTVEIGSIEHYNTLERSTKYVDPVKEPIIQETEIKDINLTTDPEEVVKTTDNETPGNTTTETQIVTKEMKKDAKQLYKMYKRLIKQNNMYKEKDPNKKKKKKKSKNKDGDVSCPSDVTEKVATTNS